MVKQQESKGLTATHSTEWDMTELEEKFVDGKKQTYVSSQNEVNAS